MLWGSVNPRIARLVAKMLFVVVVLVASTNSVNAQPNPFRRRPNGRARGPQTGGFPNSQLRTARFSTVRDSNGYYWTINSNGSVRSSSSSWFRSAQFLMINGVSFSNSASPKMTNNQEYVLGGSGNGYQVTRLVKLISAGGYVRYVDSVTNPYNTRRTVNVELVTTLRYPPRAVLTDSGKSFVVGTGKKTTAAAVIVQNRSSYPTIIQYWGRGIKAANMSIQTISTSNLQYRWSFKVTLAPKQTWSLAHAIGLRAANGTVPTKSDIRGYLKPFYDKQFLAGIPSGVRRTIANGGGGFIEISASGGQLLKAVDEFAARWQLDRKEDTLIIDDDSQLKGTVKGTKLTMKTRYGTAEVPLAEVAMIRGGNGQGGIPKVFLRNGEVLVGDAEMTGAILDSKAGIPVKLSVPQLHTLVLARKPEDGKASKGMTMLVQTQTGNRFAISDKPAIQLSAATAWGRVTVPMKDVDSLVMQRVPYPMQMVRFRDGSKLKALLSGSQVKVGSLRFGEIPLVPITVASVTRISVSPAKSIGSPHFQLVGENILVGNFADKQLRLRTSEGVVSIKTDTISLIEVDGESLKVSGADGKGVVGTLINDVVSIKALGKTWQIPVRQLVSFTRPKKKATETTASKSQSSPDATSSVAFDPAAGDAGTAPARPTRR